MELKPEHEKLIREAATTYMRFKATVAIRAAMVTSLGLTNPSGEHDLNQRAIEIADNLVAKLNKKGEQR